MTTKSHLSVLGAVMFGFAALVTTVEAQPFGPGFMMGPGMMGPSAFGRLCGPAAAGFAEWRIDQIQQLIKLTDPQRAKFDELKAASSKAADILRGACPAEFPQTVVARMEVMEKRADAMLQAVRTVRPAMEAFYATLDNDQKKRLDSDATAPRFWHWRHHW
jgi:hypothetical protein